MPDSVFPFRALKSALGLFRAAMHADGRFHTFCRSCGYELSDAEAYYSDEEQAERFPEVHAVIRVPKKDCPSCEARYIPGIDPGGKPFYEPLYGLPPRRMCLRLAIGELRRVYSIEKLYSYPQGHRAAEREVIRRFWGRTISTRMEANSRA